MPLIRNPEDAEMAACLWMASNGFPDAEVTPPGADGGVDVRASGAAAQVKAEMRPIGRPAVQQIAGIATHERRSPLFFSLSGFTDEALQWADEAGVALLQFDLQGDPTPLNSHALNLLSLDKDVAGYGVWTALLDVLEQMDSGDLPADVDVDGSIPMQPGSTPLDNNRWHIYPWVDRTYALSVTPSMAMVKAGRQLETSSWGRDGIMRIQIGQLAVEYTEGSWYQWTGNFPTAAAAGQALIGILTMFGLTLDQFEWTAMTVRDREIAWAEEERFLAGSVISLLTVDDLTNSIEDLYRKGHTSDWSFFWRMTDEELKAEGISWSYALRVFALHIRPGYLAETGVSWGDSWSFSAGWRVPISWASRIRSYPVEEVLVPVVDDEGRVYESSEGGWATLGVESKNPKKIVRFLRVTFNELGVTPSQFEVRSNDDG